MAAWRLDLNIAFSSFRGYLAPEMLQRSEYSFEVDAWALVGHFAFLSEVGLAAHALLGIYSLPFLIL